MRSIASKVISAAIVPLWLLTTVETKSQTAGELFTFCTSKEQTLSTMCGLYITGFMNGIAFEQKTRGAGRKKICMPEGITGNQVKGIFEAFMRKYPGLQTESELKQPSLLIGVALLEAYPCPRSIR